MKPWIICHMSQSLDGRIDCNMVEQISGREYYYALEEFGCQSFIEGKKSCRRHISGDSAFSAPKPAPIGKESYFIARNLRGYAISLDNPGELLWDTTDNSRRLCIMSERASRQYLDYLRSKEISYVVTGASSINLGRALEILATKFSIERLALLGGGRINGAFLAAGLIDELSVLIAPGIDGRTGQPALFDGLPEGAGPLPLKFISARPLANNVLWLRYLIENKNHFRPAAAPALVAQEQAVSPEEA